MFTPSVDGVLRTDLKATIRLDAEELERLNELAKSNGITVGKMLDRLLSDSFYREILEEDDAT